MILNKWLLLVILLNIKHQVSSFNFDLNAPVVKHLNKNVYFGYSIAQHFLRPTRQPYLLVGAPTDSLEYNGYTYNMSGAIYKCPINLHKTSDCEQIKVDFRSKKSDEVDEQYSYRDEKLKEQFKGRIFENQWFGVSLASTGNGSFSSCAHKYVHYYNFTTRDEHAAYGACYRFSNDFNQEYKHVPCLLFSHAVNTFYFNNYAYCQAGTSLSMIEDTTLMPGNAQDTYLSFGMPGALNFRGLVGVKAIGRDPMPEYVYKNKSLCKFGIENDKPMRDGYCPSLWEKYSYMGMSHVLIRRYLGNVKQSLIAAGAPRESLYGLVRFFTIMYDVSFGQVTKHLNLTLKGAHKGSYFGFSMAACDLNGDKQDDLIVGAPYFSRKNEPNIGAIYIYLNHKTKGFGSSYVLNFTGETRSLFGHSITCLGDIDKDGFNDFAVGAPYEANPGTNSNSNINTGAVYIYRGNSIASRIGLSQKILASDLSNTYKGPLATFGYTLSGGSDMDSNSYPDLAVGALNSNTVFLLRTRPVVYLESFINNNQSLQEIDHKVKECKQDSNSLENDLTCFSFEICFRLSPKSASFNIKLPMLNFSVEAEPNTTSLFSRVYFTSQKNSNSISKLIELNLEAKVCDSLTVLIKKENNDYIRPIRFLLSYRFNYDRDLNYFETKRSENDLNDLNNDPVIHQDMNKYEFEANFKKDCGSDKKCVTDLKLTAFFANLMFGEDNIPLLSFKESDSVTIGVVLENTGNNSEPAYATQIDINFDQRLDFIKKTDIEASGFTCEISSKKDVNILICKLTNDIQGVPFASNSIAKFNLTFSSTRLYRYANISSEPNIMFKLEAKTLSSDTVSSNNKVELLAKLKVRANLYLYGTKTPEQVFYSDNSLIRGESAIENLDQIGPIIEHTYKINNGGPFSVHNFQLLVDWPYESRLVNFNPSTQMKFIDGKHLLYLIEKPTKIPNNHPINVVCSSYSVDPLKISDNRLTLKKKRSIEEYDIINKAPLVEEEASSRVALIDCFSNTAYCHKINCTFYGDFSKDETISLKFTARLWNGTLVEDFAGYEKVLIKSHARIVLNDDIHDDRPNDNENSVATVAYSRIQIKVERTLPLWVYLLSVLIGLLILFLCTLGFWTLGFFERKKMGDDKYLEMSEKVKNTPY